MSKSGTRQATSLLLRSLAVAGRYKVLMIGLLVVLVAVLMAADPLGAQDVTNACPPGTAPAHDADLITYYEQIAICYLDQNISWYRSHAATNRILYYSAAVVATLGGLLLPFLSKLEPPWSDRVLSGVALAISICVALSSLLGWRENWAEFRKVQFEIEHYKRVWQIEMADTRHVSSPEAITRAKALTDKVVQDVNETISRETGGYFERRPEVKDAGLPES